MTMMVSICKTPIVICTDLILSIDKRLPWHQGTTAGDRAKRKQQQPTGNLKGKREEEIEGLWMYGTVAQLTIVMCVQGAEAVH